MWDKNRAVTFSGVPFQASYSPFPNNHDPDAQLRHKRIYISGSSHFVRHYYGNPSWFLFLRLIICLNSAGNLVWARIISIEMVSALLGSITDGASADNIIISDVKTLFVIQTESLNI